MSASLLAAVSGGSGDIGRAVVRDLTASGYEVAVGDLPAGIPHPGSFTAVDVRNENSIAAWFDAMQEAHGRPPALTVVNAGIVVPGGHLEASLTDWTRTLDVNLTGAWLTAREAARRLLAASLPGAIVFVGSWVGQHPISNLAAYCASKAGLHSIVQTMALELAGHGIRVNEIAPGYVNAGLSGKIFEVNPGLADRCREAVPVGCLIECDEIARAVVYLADPANVNLTGTTLTLDGGLSVMRGPQNLTAPK